MNLFKFLFSKDDDNTNDKLGAYPEKVHVRAMPERRYLKTSRVMTLLAAALLCGTIVLGFIIYLLAPMLRAEPMLLSIDKRFYRLEPVERSIVRTPSNLLLMENLIRDYIYLRHTIVPDIDEMRSRWGDRSYLYWYSSKDVFGLFLQEKEVRMAQMMEGLTTEVRIRFVNRVSPSLWLAEFDTIEHMPEDEKPTIKRWRALMQAGFQRRPYPSIDERIKNPLDFMVNSYSISSRGLHEENKNAKFLD